VIGVADAAHPDPIAVASVAAAGGAACVVGILLPLHLPYRESPLGIVSVTAALRIPVAERTLWLAVAVATGTAVAWSLRRGLRRRAGAESAIGLEAVGAAALFAPLWLPPPLGVPAALAAIALLVVLARGSGSAVPPAPAVAAGEAEPPRRVPAVAWAAGLVALASFAPVPSWGSGFWGGLANVVHAVPDEQLARDTWGFHAEWGQHLLWADLLRAGALPGRDYFCLYGPLYDLALLALQDVFGRSLATYTLFDGLNHLAGYLALLALVAALVRRRWLVLLVPFVAPLVDLRMGLPLAGLACLVRGLRTDARGWLALAGLFGGCAIGFSQEFGLVFAIVAALGLAVRGDAGGGAAFAAGLVAPLLPVVGWLAAGHALFPMFRDLVGYPAAVAAGFGNLPLPSLVASLPLGVVPAELLTGESTEYVLRATYAVPAICAAALLLALPLADASPLRPVASLRIARNALAADPSRLAVFLVAAFGLAAYRSALGRSDWWHVAAASPPAAVLLVAGLDACVTGLARAGAARTLAGWRVAALGLTALQSGLLVGAAPLERARLVALDLARLASGPPDVAPDPRVQELVAWVRGATREDDPVVFLPNHAGYSYLTRRPNPLPFALSHQMATDALRARAFDALRANPPRFVVWDRLPNPLDGIADRRYLGRDIARWLRDEYEPSWREDGFVVLRRRDSQPR